MIKKVEHIGIAVKDINSSTTLFERLLGVKPYKTEKVLSEGVNTAFFGIADQKIELLSSINKGSAIEKFLESKNEGVHHIALLVDSLEFEINRLEGLGFLGFKARVSGLWFARLGCRALGFKARV